MMVLLTAVLLAALAVLGVGFFTKTWKFQEIDTTPFLADDGRKYDRKKLKCPRAPRACVRECVCVCARLPK